MNRHPIENLAGIGMAFFMTLLLISLLSGFGVFAQPPEMEETLFPEIVEEKISSVTEDAIEMEVSELPTAGTVEMEVKEEEEEAADHSDAFWIRKGQTHQGDIVQQAGKPIIVDGEVHGDIVSFGAPVTVNGLVSGDVVCFGSRITVKGTVHGDVVVIGGSVECHGKVQGDIVTIGGNVRFQPGAEVKGDVVALGGNIQSMENAQLHGSVTNIFSFSKLFKSFRGFPFTDFTSHWHPSGFAFFPVILVLWLSKLVLFIGLALLLEALFGEKLANSVVNMRHHLGRNMLVGILWYLVAYTLLILFVLLSFILIGIPFLLLLVLFWTVLKFFGTVVIYRWLGQTLAERINKPDMSPYLAIVLGALVLGLVRWIPIVGFLVGIVAALAGVGTSIMSRFGTRPENGGQTSLTPATE